MFIFGTMVVVVFFIVTLSVYFILEMVKIKNLECTGRKIVTSIVCGILGSIIYGFMNPGCESLLDDSFADAACRFGSISGIDSIKESFII